jgi:uncharacterized membrane protein
MVQSWVFTPAVALYGLLTGSLTFVAGTLWGGLAGLFILVGFYNFAHSLKSGSVSINAPVFRLSFVITAALAVLLLGEPLTPHKIAGIALALTAAWLVLVATAAVGIGNFIYTYGLRAGATPASLIVAQGIVVVTLATAFVATMDRRIQPSRAALRYAPMAAIVLASAFVFLVESLARGEASVVVPIAQMGFGVTALLGFLFLREPFTARKGAGLVVALAAMASLAYG